MASIFTLTTKVSRFASDAAGLEKTLRLLQGISQITIANLPSSPKTVAPWVQARKQFALGRRYLRFFKFIDAFSNASKAWWSSSSTSSGRGGGGSGGGGINAVLEVGRWSCLGMYLLMESCTILDATEIHPSPWAPVLLLEAHRFWFYSLLFSLTSRLLQISQSPSTTPLPWPPLRQLLTDAFDILIPGSVTGWAVTSPAIVGAATVASTLLASQEIWDRVQRPAIASSSSLGSRNLAPGGEGRPERKRRVRMGKQKEGEEEEREGYELRERKRR